MPEEYKTAWGKVWDSAAWGEKLRTREANKRVARETHRRATHVIRDRFVMYGEIFLSIFGLRAKKRKATANPIPATLRPWVPANYNRTVDSIPEYSKQLRAFCTASQWVHLCKQYPGLEE